MLLTCQRAACVKADAVAALPNLPVELVQTAEGVTGCTQQKQQA